MKAVALLALAALAGSCGAEKSPDEVRVFAASSLTDVMQTIAADFERETGTKVKLNFASSSTLAKQIVEGAPCDVFLSADQEWADFVEKAGLVEPGTRRDLLTNSLFVVFRFQETHEWLSHWDADVVVSSPVSALRQREVRSIAIGDPDHVPAGRYAREYLRTHGAWQDLQGKLVPCDSVRAALALVERGEADAGIVYRTDAIASSRVIRWDVKSAVQGPSIRYPVFRVRGCVRKAARFDMYLDSLAARKVFEWAGFGIVKAVD